jgi:cytochrome c oxidase subunit 2
MKQIPTSLITLTAGILVTLFSLWVGQHHGLLPEQASAQAPLVDSLFNLMVTFSTALLLVVMGAMIVFIIQFRRRPGDDGDGLPIDGNLQLEAFWTVIPAVIIIVLATYSVDVFERMGGFNPGDHSHHGMISHHAAALVAQAEPSEDMATDVSAPLMAAGEAEASETKTRTYGYGAAPDRATKAADLVVNVLGIQYAWLFNYPDGVVAGELHVPIGKDVQLKLAANDVIHSFWVPNFRLKQDAIPGEPTELRFTATKLGSYPIVCAELCGAYHGSMRSTVVVETPEEFEQWFQSNKVAQAKGTTTLAQQPASVVEAHARDMGITSQMLAQLPHHASPAIANHD